MNWFMAFLHHLLAFILVSALAYEYLLISKPLTLERAQSLVITDRIYGISAILLLAAGGLRLFYFEKSASYYFHSAPFIAKLILFALVGILSIYPTKIFLHWQKILANQHLPEVNTASLSMLQRLILLQLLGIIGILLCASMAAKGIGYFS